MPLILASLWLTDADAAQQGPRWLPFDFTPLYGGCPSLFTNVTPAIGNGFVEQIGGSVGMCSIEAGDCCRLTYYHEPPFTQTTKPQIPTANAGLNSRAPQPPPQPAAQASPNASAPLAPANASAPPAPPGAPAPQNQQLLTATVQPDWVVPLATQIGASSYFLPLGTAAEAASVGPEVIRELQAVRPLNYWNLVDFQGGNYAIVDGGGAGELMRVTSCSFARLP